MPTFRPLSELELIQLRGALEANGRRGTPVRVCRDDTTAAAVRSAGPAGATAAYRTALRRAFGKVAAYLGRSVPRIDVGLDVPEEPAGPDDDRVADAVASIPCHYA